MTLGPVIPRHVRAWWGVQAQVNWWLADRWELKRKGWRRRRRGLHSWWEPPREMLP